jgi:hypothetical protein
MPSLVTLSKGTYLAVRVSVDLTVASQVRIPCGVVSGWGTGALGPRLGYSPEWMPWIEAQ